MNIRFRKARLTAAAAALVFLFTAAAGPALWAGEEEGRGNCLKTLKILIACLEHFYADLPPLRAALTLWVLRDYEFCLKYLDEIDI